MWDFITFFISWCQFDSGLSYFIAIVDDEADSAYLFKLALSVLVSILWHLLILLSLLVKEHVEHNHARYKLVLSDVKMPVMDGIELTKRIADKDRFILDFCL